MEPHPAEEGSAPPSLSWDIVRGSLLLRQQALHPHSSAAAAAQADKRSVSFA